MSIFIDCDVLLDVGLNRQPFVETSGLLLDYLSKYPYKGCIAWHSLSNIYYIAAKHSNQQIVRDFITELSQFLYIVPTTNQDVQIAIHLPISDFEDALQCAAALNCHAQVLITRNIKDYQNSPIPAFTPEDYIKQLDTN
jgi:hypothetical protein